jgi:hypothetical protein
MAVIVFSGFAKRLNVVMWLRHNYPNYASWPKATHEAVYLPSDVALGVHPLVTSALGILVTGIVLLTVGDNKGIRAFEIVGGILTLPTVVFFGLFILGALLKAFAESGSGNYRRPPQEVRTEKALSVLAMRMASAGDDGMRPLYRLWHSFYSHDSLNMRFGLEFSSYRQGRKLLLPATVASDVAREVDRLRKEFADLSVDNVIPLKFQKQALSRQAKLDSLPKYQVIPASK